MISLRDGLTHRSARVNGIRVHFAEGGDGPPLVLLHGWPETSFAWRKQVPVLSRHFHLIIPDLRGYGASEKPVGGYDKRTMAQDVRALIDYLGHTRIALVGHDRGARVGTRFAKDHSEVLDRLVVLDNVPTRAIFDAIDAPLARRLWFFFFNQVHDLPEALVAGREDLWLRWFFERWCYDPTAISDAEIAVYARSYAQPGALRGSFADYRAGTEDWAQDCEDAETPITCPILTLWGAKFEDVGGTFDVLATWQAMGTDVRGFGIECCGHLPHEERPEVVNQALLEFLEPYRTSYESAAQATACETASK